MSKYRNMDIKRLTGMFKALSNPNRLRIFLRLVSCCENGNCPELGDGACSCVGEIGESLAISNSTLSHHLKELHRSGLICMERRGQNVVCWVDPKVLEIPAEFFRLS